MKTTALRSFVLPLLCAVWIPFNASASTSREWNFDVFLDDQPIGYHRFHLKTEGDTHQLSSEARFRVKILGFTVYHYDHQSQELWQHNCLQHIDASTDDNGNDLFVRGSSSGEQLLLQDHAGSNGLPGCVMTFAYWNPTILEQQHLLNVQTGEYLAVQVKILGENMLKLEDQAVKAQHYRISTGESDIELWYSGDQDWLGLRSTTRGGRQLDYRRVPSPVETWSRSDG